MAQAKAEIDIVARDKASQAFNSVTKSMKKASAAGSFIGNLAADLTKTGLTAVKAFATGSVNAFAAVEDATGAAGVVFGAQLPQIVKFGEEAATALGLSQRQAIEATNTFGTLGKVAGKEGQGLSDFAIDLSSLSADLASFKGTTTEEAITAVGAALRGESEPIRAYGVLLDEAAVKAEAAAIGIVKPIKDLDKIKAAQVAAIERQRKYNEAVKKFGPNSLEAEKAQVQLTAANKALADATAGSVPELTQQQKVLARQSLIFKQTKDAQGDYARTSTSTANTQKTLAAELENAQVKLGKQLAPALTAIRQILIRVVKALAGMAAAISVVIGFFQDHTTTVKILAGVITTILLPTMVRLSVQYAVVAAQAVASAAKQVASWLATQLAAYRSWVVTAVVFTGMIAGWIKLGIQAALNAAKVVAAWVLMGAQALLAAARMALAWIIAMGPIALVIAAVVGLVVIIVKNWDKIKSATAAAFKWIWEKVKQVFGWLKDLFLNFTGPGLIIKHFDSIVAFIKTVPGKIKDAAKGMFDGITDAFKAAINWIIGKWNGLELGIPAIDTHIPGVGKVGGFSLSTPDIPKLAKGGIVTKPTLAVIGEAGPEKVIPLKRGGGGEGGVTFIIQGAVDPTATVRQIRSLFLQVQKNTGQDYGIR